MEEKIYEIEVILRRNADEVSCGRIRQKKADCDRGEGQIIGCMEAEIITTVRDYENRSSQQKDAYVFTQISESAFCEREKIDGIVNILDNFLEQIHFFYLLFRL